MKRYVALTSLLLLCFFAATAQNLRPGFDKEEYKELLYVVARHGDSAYFRRLPEPAHFNFVYRSASIGLENLWHLWVSDRKVAALSIRGTTKDMISWIGNFHAAMLPAKGELLLDGGRKFPYALAEDPRAAVHAGWLIGMAYLAEDMLPKIDSCYKAGIKEYVIIGHSQGGAIAFLMNSYLHSLIKQGRLPQDMVIKTYCSAGPKPGNLYYAYEYERMTQPGWAYNVVNSADWVPQTPMSVQNVEDYNNLNPFTKAPQYIRSLGFPKSWVFNYLYRRLSRPTRKAQRRYEKYMGTMLAKQIQKHIPGYKTPPFAHTADYVRTGNTIVLYAEGEDYFSRFPDNSENIFIHHFFEPYLFLLDTLP